MKRGIWTKTLIVALFIALIFPVSFSGCTEGVPPSEETCFEDEIAQVQVLITMTEEMPLSEEAKSAIVSGWQGVIAQYEQGLEADEQIQAVLDDTESYYTVEVCPFCPLVCEQKCRLWKDVGNGVPSPYLICYCACLAGKEQRKEIAEPMPIPEGVATIVLSPPMVEQPGDEIAAVVTIAPLGLPTPEYSPSTEIELTPSEDLSYADMGPLTIIAVIETSEVAEFPDGGLLLEHTIDPALIAADGTYTFSFEIVGVSAGEIGMTLFCIIGEGACAWGIIGCFIGCRDDELTAAQYATCVCDCLDDLSWPASAACEAFPLTFRAVWAKLGCAGASPY